MIKKLLKIGEIIAKKAEKASKEKLDDIAREVKEELGIDISKDNIVDLGCLVYDFPVRFIFSLEKDIKLNDITLQKEEVANVKYVTIKCKI